MNNFRTKRILILALLCICSGIAPTYEANAGDSPAVASTNRIYAYDFNAMFEELRTVRKEDAGSARLDVSPIVGKYIPFGRPIEELFLALHEKGFQIYQVRNKKALGISGDEDGYSAVLHQSKGLFWSLGLMSDELVIRIVVRDHQVAATTAAITLLHP